METKTNNICIKLTKEEAIVFFEWLARFNEQHENTSNLFEDQAEERVLWNIEAVLETKLSEPFEENYLDILSNARKEVRD